MLWSGSATPLRGPQTWGWAWPGSGPGVSSSPLTHKTAQAARARAGCGARLHWRRTNAARRQSACASLCHIGIARHASSPSLPLLPPGGQPRAERHALTNCPHACARMPACGPDYVRMRPALLRACVCARAHGMAWPCTSPRQALFDKHAVDYVELIPATSTSDFNVRPAVMLLGK